MVLGSCCAVMNNPDHDTLVRAIDDARRILGEYLEPGQRDATRTVERLLGGVDTYRIHKMMAARVTTAR